MPDHTDDELRQLAATNHYTQLLRDYVDTFATDAGQRVLEDLRVKCYADRTTLVRPSASAPIDVHHTLWNEGARAMYLGIVERIEKGRRARQPQATHAVGTLSLDAGKLVD